MILAVKTENVGKRYDMDGETVHALRDVSLDVPEGDYVAVMGASGSGKSTLLNLLGCLDRPTKGKIILGGENITEADDDRLSEIRGSRIGFVFQSYNLLPHFTVLENIEVPLTYQGGITRQLRERSRELAEMVGLGDRLSHRPTQLSGGQQQRVAIARSLINNPVYMLGRRTDRQPRHPHHRGNPRTPATTQRTRQDHHHRHPRIGSRRTSEAKSCG